MVHFYVMHITVYKDMTIDDVPTLWKARVQAELDKSATAAVTAMSLTTATPTLMLPATVMGLLHLV